MNQPVVAEAPGLGALECVGECNEGRAGGKFGCPGRHDSVRDALGEQDTRECCEGTPVGRGMNRLRAQGRRRK